MAYRQKYAPAVGISAVRGWCLKYIDDAGKAPSRKPNARTALNVEIAAKRLRTSTPPEGIWVVGFLDLKAGQWAGDDHVFFMKNKGGGKYEIRDSETNGGGRGVYGSIAEIIRWFGNYAPVYVGWSTHCDGRQYVEEYTPAKPAAPKPSFKRIGHKGTFKVTASAIKVRSSPKVSSSTDTGAFYKTGQTFRYDSYVVTNGYVWLSYIAGSGKRRYVAEGPLDGNAKNVWGTGGV